MKKNHNRLLNQILFRAIVTGIIAGWFWCISIIVLHYFNFTEVGAMVLVKKLFQDGSWLTKWKANVLFIIISIVLSIIIAIAYYFLFKKKESWIIGALYGIFIWVVLYYIFPTVFYQYNPISHLETQSNVTMFCLFLLYGVFIGYSISYDYKLNNDY